MMAQRKRIVLATIGSLGDLHPMLALGLELKRRGHRVTIASTGFYREKVEGLGMEFCPLRPNWDPTQSELIAQCEDLKSGPEVLFRQLALPHLRDTYDDLQAVVTDADLMLAGELVFPAPLLGEKFGLPWVSVILSPTSFFSAYDPSLLVNAPWAYRLRHAGWLVNRAVLNFGRFAARPWWEPVRQLRRELGLRVECDPVFRDKFSPRLVLALFSHVLAQPQPDWPKQTIQPGFVFFDGAADEDQARLADFLAAGDPPIVFTLGSTAVHAPGSFYETSIAAAQKLNRRAVLLGAKLLSKPDGLEDILTLPYAPFSQIFPHAAAIVHQGGSGTTGQALRAGRSQLIVPFGWDQPDNAERAARLGVALHLPRRVYSAQTASSALARLLEKGSYNERALRAAEQMKSEDALETACDAIEASVH